MGVTALASLHKCLYMSLHERLHATGGRPDVCRATAKNCVSRTEQTRLLKPSSRAAVPSYTMSVVGTPVMHRISRR